MNPYCSLSDDFYVNMNLSTEMELPANRETVLLSAPVRPSPSQFSSHAASPSGMAT